MNEVREEIAKILAPNGMAGDVEVDRGPNGEPEPVCQYFAAQAGPFQGDTRVTVLGPEEVARILALIDAGAPVESAPLGRDKDNRGAVPCPGYVRIRTAYMEGYNDAVAEVKEFVAKKARKKP